MRAIDTNVLVRLIARDDADQTRHAEEFVNRGAWVSHLVLLETVWVLESVYGLDRERIAVAIGMLLEHSQILLDSPDVVRAAAQQFGLDKKVGFSDCLILETARSAGHLPLGTFDRALSRLAGTEAV
ncbi:MAG: type II toxin-antitoxin system VapC family toxin [Thermoanaerobaculia bacterium]|nr:type II toxin-antitoxin system VapC family toxin [Thermoanaerobaculia bacterium]